MARYGWQRSSCQTVRRNGGVTDARQVGYNDGKSKLTMRNQSPHPRGFSIAVQQNQCWALACSQVMQLHAINLRRAKQSSLSDASAR